MNITCVCGRSLQLKNWTRPTKCECGTEWCSRGHLRTEESTTEKLIAGRPARVCKECNNNAVRQVRSDPAYRERERKVTAARHRALTRLARQYPGTFKAIYDEELEAAGVELLIPN